MLATQIHYHVHCFRAHEVFSRRCSAAKALPRVAISSASATHITSTQSHISSPNSIHSRVRFLKRRLASSSSISSSSAAQGQILPELLKNVSDFDEAAGACIAEAYAAARQTHSSVSTQHLMYGLLTSSPASIQPFLTQLHELGIDAAMIQQEFPEQQQRMWGDPVLDKEAAWLLAGLACGPCEQINTGE